MMLSSQSAPFKPCMGHVMVASSCQCSVVQSFFLNSFPPHISLQAYVYKTGRYTWWSYFWPTDVWEMDLEMWWPWSHLINSKLIKAYRQAVGNLLDGKSVTNTWNDSIKIRLCARFKALRIPCLLEILKFIGANLWYTLFRGFNSTGSS